MLQTFKVVPRAAPQTAALNILITGAARGIGFELVKQYSEAYASNVVIAAVRDVNAAGPLVTFATSHPNVHVVPLDTSNEASINESVKKLPVDFKHVDILFNNAGVLGKSTPLPALDATSINELLHINVTGPLLVVKAYQSLLLAAKYPKVINVSSELGAANFSVPVAQFGVIPYGASKAALNFINLALKTAVPEVTFLSISPGWVGTDMGGSFGTKAPLLVEDTVSALIEMAQSKTKEDSGSFFDVVSGNKLVH